MNPPNTYTYRQSELPSLTAEIKAEIFEIDFSVANLILKTQGEIVALNMLVDTLANCLNDAELNLQCIRIVPDGGEPELLPRAIGFTDLPILEKQLFVSTAATNTVAIKMIATFLGCDFAQAAAHLSRLVSSDLEEISPEQVEEIVVELAKSLHDEPNKPIHKIVF